MAKTREDALRELQEELDGILKDARAAFEGRYSKELEGLHGLSDEDLAALIPGIEGHVAYSALIEVVKSASAANLKVAELRKRIKALGENVVAIAKKVGLPT